MKSTRLLNLSTLALAAAFSVGGLAAQGGEDAPVAWRKVTPAQIEGQGWTDTQHPFDRLPARAEAIVRPPVWELSQDAAGLNVRFSTNAASISIRWTLNTSELAMNHMPATGVSGVDLYVRRDGRWHYLATGRPENFPVNEIEVIAGMEPQEAEYRLYLPLYNGVSELQIGVPNGASFEFVEQGDARPAPLVFYGTSITQGGCASRPGMSYPAILGRRLDAPIINLGFSGNGKAEPEMARLLAELTPAAYVLDPIPNLLPEQVAELLPGFVAILRERHPNVPILLVENPLLPPMAFVAASAARVNDSNKFVRQVYQDLVTAGDRHICLVPACDLVAEGGEATVDGLHPTDLGFIRLADSIEPQLREALKPLP